MVTKMIRSLNDATAGVVYQIHGRGYWPQIVVAVHTLRKHYSGPIALMALDDAGREIARRLADTPGMQPIQICSPSTIHVKARNSGYVAKTRIIPVCPFTHGIFLDADTVVAGNWNRIDELVPQDDEPVVLTQFADWRSNGKRISSRCLKWNDVATREVTLCCNMPYKAVNTGVFGFRRDSNYFQRDWEEMTARNVSFICDEIAAQLLVPMLGQSLRILNDEFNCSPIYGVNKNKAVVWHFHGGKHLRPEAGMRWLGPYTECVGLNIAGIRDWSSFVYKGDQIVDIGIV